VRRRRREPPVKRVARVLPEGRDGLSLRRGRDVKRAQLTWVEGLTIALAFWLSVLPGGLRRVARRDI
jgi:hypothetical protein